MPTETLHTVILAGGSGTRFWPLSREQMPKQLLNITGDRSMLALTMDRAQAISSEECIWVVTTRSQAGQIKRELRTLGLSGVNVLEEPAGRNTAAAIGLAALHVIQKDPQGVLAVFPADHHIEQRERFLDLIQEGKKLALRGWLVTLGIKPTSPETGYGYIQRESPLNDGQGLDATFQSFKVARFTEKPDRKKAEAYIRTGNFYWNSGIFIWQAPLFVEEMERHLPEHRQGLQQISSLIGKVSQESPQLEEIYTNLDSISVDYGILERSDRVAVIPAEIGWSDVGSWAALREILERDKDENVLQGNTLALDTKNSLIRSEGRLVATLGVEGLVVVDTADALLVCPEERSQEVKEIVQKLRDEDREEALIHRMVPKPWGAYKVLDREKQYQVKWLDVKPGERLSLQSHEHRAEHWTVVAGVATVTVDDQIVDVPRGKHIYIPVKSRHRAENRGQELVRIIEVQSGDYLGEDDIIRYEDDYGREG